MGFPVFEVPVYNRTRPGKSSEGSTRLAVFRAVLISHPDVV
jgi:hypothetical protein